MMVGVLCHPGGGRRAKRRGIGVSQMKDWFKMRRVVF